MVLWFILFQSSYREKGSISWSTGCVGNKITLLWRTASQEGPPTTFSGKRLAVQIGMCLNELPHSRVDDLLCHCESCNWVSNRFLLEVRVLFAVAQCSCVSGHVLCCVCVLDSTGRISSPTWCRETLERELWSPASCAERESTHRRREMRRASVIECLFWQWHKSI